MLLLGSSSCGRLGYEAGQGDSREDPPTGDRDGSSSTLRDADVPGNEADTSAVDASLDHPCRLVENWVCAQGGGGDCIAECTAPNGTYTLEILTSSSDYFCVAPAQVEMTCEPTASQNCDGCMALALAECCFP